MANTNEIKKRIGEDIFEELKKVTWPSRRDIIKLSSVVIIISIVVAAYVGALDVIFAKLLEFLTKVK
jgi:preprotein translocase SecE subunit